MAMYSFVPTFQEAKFCGVLSCVFDELGCAKGEESLWNTVLYHGANASFARKGWCSHKNIN